MSAVVSVEWAIQQAAHVANQAKLAILLSAVAEEYASARSTVGTASTTLAATAFRGRSQVSTATHTLGLTSTPISHSASAGRTVMAATSTPRMAALPRMYSNRPTGRVK